MSEKIVFLEGQKTILRPLCEETDLEPLTKWINDQRVTRHLSGGAYPRTQEDERDWFKRHKGQSNEIVLALEAKDPEGCSTFIGTMGLHRINLVNGNASTGALIGMKDMRGKGYGTDAKMMLLHHAFARLGLRTVGSSVLSSNPRSKAYQEKTGYKEVGRRHGWILVNGKWVDEIFMQVWRRDFWAIWKKKGYHEHMKSLGLD